MTPHALVLAAPIVKAAAPPPSAAAAAAEEAARFPSSRVRFDGREMCRRVDGGQPAPRARVLQHDDVRAMDDRALCAGLLKLRALLCPVA